MKLLFQILIILCLARPLYANNITSAISPTTTITNQSFFINGTFTINTNITFTNCQFYFMANAKINILNNASLTLNNCTLQAGCGAMWDGIYADDVSEQLIINECTISDMENGVNVSSNAMLASTGSTYKNTAKYAINLTNISSTIQIKISDDALSQMALHITNNNIGDLYNNANAKIGDIANGDVWEMNEAQVNDWCLRMMRYGTTTLEPSEVESLKTLANACPYNQGTAVYKARVLNAIYTPNAQYNDRVGCIPTGQYKMANGSGNNATNLDSLEEALLLQQYPIGKLVNEGIDVQQNTEPIQISDILNNTILPNPSNGKITIIYKSNIDGVLNIFDAQGKQIATILMPKENARIETELNNIANGIYTYQFVFANNITKGKLVIIK